MDAEGWPTPVPSGYRFNWANWYSGSTIDPLYEPDTPDEPVYSSSNTVPVSKLNNFWILFVGPIDDDDITSGCILNITVEGLLSTADHEGCNSQPVWTF